MSNTKLITISYFSDSKTGICGSDLKNTDRNVHINLAYILSLSPPEEFRLPLSGDKCGKYSQLVMSNNDTYYIREVDYDKIQFELKHLVP